MKDIHRFECQKCGACCRWLFFPVANSLVGPSVQRKQEFYFARDNGIKLQWSDAHEILYVCVPHVCRHLNVTDNTCNIYKDRPAWCKENIGKNYSWLKCQGKYVKVEEEK